MQDGDGQELDEATVEAYLRRLGLEGRPAPTAANLHELIDRHMRAVPFENIDIVDGRRIVLGTAVAVDKIVRRGRGGFCFELNEAFRALLVALGYRVERLEGRVWVAADARYGAPFDHLALKVEAEGGLYLADVGFGDSFRGAIAFPEGEGRDLSGRYRLAPAGEDLLLLERLEAPAGSSVQPLYTLTTGPRRLEDYAPLAAYHQSDPASLFMRGRLASLATEEGRVTLAGNRLIETVAGGRQELVLAEAAVPGVLAEIFGIRRD